MPERCLEEEQKACQSTVCTLEKSSAYKKNKMLVNEELLVFGAVPAVDRRLVLGQRVCTDHLFLEA